MRTLSTQIFLSADIGVPIDVEAAGTALENPYVYDSVARDLKAMERQGLLRVVDEKCLQGRSDGPIDRISFVRLR
jgi:hypothetical protein